MDRQIIYPGAIPLETDLLNTNKNAMIGLSKLAAAILGTSTFLNGLACTPTGPASLQVYVAPGEIYSLQNIDGTAYSSIALDNTHSILKQGISLDQLTLSCPAPGTAGQSINYLIQVTYQDTDSGATVLPYYNASNPSQAYSGPANSGTAQNTVRKGVCTVSAKAGIAATTGTQTTPAPDAGYVGAFVVTVANGQTQITAPNISTYAGAPFLPTGGLVVGGLQNNLCNSSVAGGTADALTGSYYPGITALPAAGAGVLTLYLRASSPNATTTPNFTPNSGVIPTKTIVKGAGSALVPGDIAGGGHWIELQYDATLDKWVLLNPATGVNGVSLNNTNTWTKGQRGLPGQLTDGATITPDFAAANNFQVVLGGNRTLANPSNAAQGQSGVIEVFQDATGSRTLALDWGYSPPNGVAPTLSTTALTRDQWAYYVGTAADSVVTISIASPGVVSWANHGLKGGEKIRFSTTGALPTGISAGVTYFVKPVDANTFQLSATLGGTAINTSGTQSGVHTASARSITISQLKAIA